MLVHAPCRPGEHINEDWPLEAKWDYPDSKLRTEQLILTERGDIPTALLRIAGVYTDRCESIPLAHQIQRIYERRLTANVFPGDVSTGQSFVHLDDLLQAFRAVVGRRAQLPPVATMLIGEPEPLSYEKLQQTLGRLLHEEPEWETISIPKAVAKAGAWVQDKIPGVEEPFIKPWMIDLADDHYALDITRARTLLGWEPGHSLYETLPKMVEALKADPAGWYRHNKLEGPPLGVWLMSAPAVLGVSGAAANSGHVTGALVVTWAVIAFGEVSRPARLLNIFMGLWLIAAPWLLSGGTEASRWNDVLTGAILIPLSIPCGRIGDRFGGLNRYMI